MLSILVTIAVNRAEALNSAEGGSLGFEWRNYNGVEADKSCTLQVTGARVTTAALFPQSHYLCSTCNAFLLNCMF